MEKLQMLEAYFSEKNAKMEYHLGLQKNKISFQLSLLLIIN